MRLTKFVLKCILAALPIIIMIVYIQLCPFFYMDAEYPSWRFTKDVVTGKQYQDESFDILILGDSGAMSSFVPKELSDSCVNLSVGGGTSVEMYYFLKEYLENHPAPKRIVMMYAPFHYFTIDNYENRTMYFKALRIDDLKELYENARKKEVSEIYNDSTIMGDISCRLGLPTKYLPAITASRFFGRYSDNKSSYEDLVKNHGYGPFGTDDGCDEESYECSYDGLPFTPELYLITDYLVKIDDLCELYGIDGVLVQPALNEATYAGINQNYKSIYESYIRDVVALHMTHFYVEPELRCYENKYFGDVSHLNTEGAEKFSREIKATYPIFFGSDS